MKPNTNFNLNVNDIKIIEEALRTRMGVIDDPSIKSNINELLGKIHNQKNWYRPKTDTYVSG